MFRYNFQKTRLYVCLGKCIYIYICIEIFSLHLTICSHNTCTRYSKVYNISNRFHLRFAFRIFFQTENIDKLTETFCMINLNAENRTKSFDIKEIRDSCRSYILVDHYCCFWSNKILQFFYSLSFSFLFFFFFLITRFTFRCCRWLMT